MFRVALFVYTWIVDYTIWWKLKLKLLLIATCLIGSCCSSNVLSKVKYIELCFKIDLFSWHTYVHRVHNCPFRHFTHDRYFQWTFSSTVKSSVRWWQIPVLVYEVGKAGLDILFPLFWFSKMAIFFVLKGSFRRFSILITILWKHGNLWTPNFADCQYFPNSRGRAISLIELMIDVPVI